MNRFISSSVIFLVVVLIFGYFGGQVKNIQDISIHISSAGVSEGLPKIIIDAGHGGEDGGTSSKDGLIEKDVNLFISNALKDCFEKGGYTVIMTRTEDILLYDRTKDYKGHKKEMDLAARRKIADENPDSIFISVHMNSFPERQYRGLQVWFSKNDPRSQALAKAIQDNSVLIMPENNRKIKAAGSNINLLFNIRSPAVLVECGFLSNPIDCENFSHDEYRKKVAENIFQSVDGYVKSNSTTSLF